MTKVFQGNTDAKQFAETESRKSKSVLYLIKKNIGGLKYVVSDEESQLLGNESKLMNTYKNGEIVVKKEETKTESDV